MARWTKKGAVSRMNDNSLLQEAMQVEPMLRPIIEEAKRQRNISGYNRIRKYVGLRNRAIRFVGITAENEKLRANKYYDAVRGAIDDLLPPDDTDLYPDGKPSTAKAAKRRSKKPSKRDKLTASQRFSILERDNFTCRACGRSRLRADDVILHVDHIVPIAEGGKTEPENLQTLCRDCNLGKGTKIVEQMKIS